MGRLLHEETGRKRSMRNYETLLSSLAILYLRPIEWAIEWGTNQFMRGTPNTHSLTNLETRDHPLTNQLIVQENLNAKTRRTF